MGGINSFAGRFCVRVIISTPSAVDASVPRRAGDLNDGQYPLYTHHNMSGAGSAAAHGLYSAARGCTAEYIGQLYTTNGLALVNQRPFVTLTLTSMWPGDICGAKRDDIVRCCREALEFAGSAEEVARETLAMFVQELQPGSATVYIEPTRLAFGAPVLRLRGAVKHTNSAGGVETGGERVHTVAMSSLTTQGSYGLGAHRAPLDTAALQDMRTSVLKEDATQEEVGGEPWVVEYWDEQRALVHWVDATVLQYCPSLELDTTMSLSATPHPMAAGGASPTQTGAEEAPGGG